DHGKGERGRLAGAGLGASEDVASPEHVRNGLFLDGGRRGVTSVCDRLQDLRGEAQIFKTHTEICFSRVLLMFTPLYLGVGAGKSIDFGRFTRQYVLSDPGDLSFANYG